MTYEISEIETKVITEEPKDALVAIKFTAKNLSMEEDYFIVLQGVDDDGFELAEITIDAKIPINEKRTLTTNKRINSDLFYQIVEWQVK